MLGCGGPNQVPLDFAWRGWDLNPRSLTYEDSEMAELLYPDIVTHSNRTVHRLPYPRESTQPFTWSAQLFTSSCGTWFPLHADSPRIERGRTGLQPVALT